MSPSGDDAAAGTEAAPVRTIARAVAVAPRGGTIVLRAGTYHESVHVPSNKPVTVQNYPHEAVWLDGSSAVADWTPAGRTWVHDGWNAQFDSTAGFTSAAAEGSGAGWSFIDPAHPMASHPDQMWIDGARLTQVASADAVTAGTFFADYARHRLIIGDDPSGKDVRAADLGIALDIQSPHSTVRGIGVHRYATSLPEIAMVRLAGDHDAVENLYVAESGSSGIAATTSNITIDRVTTTKNALLGIHVNTADGLVVTNTVANENTIEHFNSSPVSGGMKTSKTRGVTVANDDFSDNDGYGLWFDESTYAVTVADTTITDNTAHGLSYEISSTATITNNVITGNGQDGVKINNSDQVAVWNNLISGNGRNIEVVNDDRRAADLSVPGHDRRQTLPDPTQPWISDHDSIVNNIIGPAKNGDYAVYIYDHSGRFSADEMHLTIDGNRFTRTAGGTEIAWYLGNGKTTLYNSMSRFAAETGQGAGNGEVDTAGKALDDAASQSRPDAIAGLSVQKSEATYVGPTAP